MKIFNIILFITLPLLGLSQSGNPTVDDIATPKFGSGIEQDAQSSVTSSTGKVSTSVPIANISANSVSFPISLSYNGENVFDQAQKQNKYEPTGILGVGWSLQMPRIVADTKQTGNREDDTFYLLDGTNNTKLICTKKTVPPALTRGNVIWEFEMEKYAPYKIKYYKSNIDFNFGGPTGDGFVETTLDYWVITDEKGIQHFYGQNDNARENLIAWGNWIGDSKETSGTSKHTIAWNINKISDQFNNQILFTYEKTEQRVNTSGLKHTEASYVKKVSSSNGQNVVFAYDNKQSFEYYEPHKEQSEPDAYQERYEKRFLQNIRIYDRKNNLQLTHDLGYLISNESSVNNKKRYLTSITEISPSGTRLPSQEFEYYLSGDFKGGLKKVISPMGGSTTYNYSKKLLFQNNNDYWIAGSLTGIYTTIARYVGDNYSLKLEVQGNYSFPNDYPLNGDKNVRLVRDFWTGSRWKRTEYKIPRKVQFRTNGFFNDFYMNNVKFAFGEDYYAMLVYDKGTDRGSLYLFHLNQDGITWSENSYSNLLLEANDGDEEPALMSGEDFVALGTSRTGRVYKYLWNGNRWDTSTLNLGNRQYFYGANNNFILILDEDGGTDYLTGRSHTDNYYVHYLDAERKWNTKSWSSSLDPYIGQISKASFFYPSNSMTGFVADHNPEFFIRWDENFNVVAVESNVLGTVEDRFPLTSAGGGLFVLHRKWDSGPLTPIKAVRFNGVSWDIQNLNARSLLAISENAVLSRESVNGASYTHVLSTYNPNSSSNKWTQTPLNSTYSNIEQPTAYAMANDLFISGQAIYRRTNTGISYIGDYNPYQYTTKAASGGYDYVYAEFKESRNGDFYRASMFYIDKKDGALKSILLGQENLDTYHQGIQNWGTVNFGGNRPYFGRNTFLDNNQKFNRIIDNQIGQNIYDIVVSEIQINDDRGQVRKTQYTYDDFNALPDDKTVFYGKVTMTNKGLGSSTLGKTVSYFNNGKNDITLGGFPLRTETFKGVSTLVKKSSSTWKKYFKNHINSASKIVGTGYYSRITQQYEELRFSGNKLIKNTTSNSYNNIGILTSTQKTNSEGLLEKSTIKLGYEQYNFMKDKNMISYPYETKNIIDGNEESVSRAVWSEDNGKINLVENISGPNAQKLRADNKMSAFDSKGNILEINNSNGIFNAMLYGNSGFNKVASISNATYQDVINSLDVSYSQLQNLNNIQLKTELLKLYDRLPNSMINLNLFDSNGRIITSIDERMQETNFYYDDFGRLEYVTDHDDKVLKKNIYNYGAN